jgi:hypothetical protein
MKVKQVSALGIVEMALPGAGVMEQAIAPRRADPVPQTVCSLTLTLVPSGETAYSLMYE